VKTLGRSQTRMRNESNPYKGMTPPSTQNLNALGLWVFFLIYCSTFSFLSNMKLRLILEYLTHLYYEKNCSQQFRSHLLFNNLNKKKTKHGIASHRLLYTYKLIQNLVIGENLITSIIRSITVVWVCGGRSSDLNKKKGLRKQLTIKHNHKIK